MYVKCKACPLTCDNKAKGDTPGVPVTSDVTGTVNNNLSARTKEINSGRDKVLNNGESTQTKVNKENNDLDLLGSAYDKSLVGQAENKFKDAVEKIQENIPKRVLEGAQEGNNLSHGFPLNESADERNHGKPGDPHKQK